MNASTFAEVRTKLNDGTYVMTADLQAFCNEANEMAMTMMRIPAYELVSRDLERLLVKGNSYLAYRRGDPKTARELEDKHAKA